MSREYRYIFIIVRNSPLCIRRLFPVLLLFSTLVLTRQLSVDQPEKLPVFFVIEDRIVQLLGEMLKPKAVTDLVANNDNVLRVFYSLRICFGIIVGKISLFYYFLAICKTQKVRIKSDFSR